MRTNIILACFVVAALLGSCTNDYEAPNKEIPSFDGKGMQIITIEQLKTQYMKSQSEFKSVDTILDDVVIGGEVIANDISGNIYKSFVIRDSTSAINISIDAYNLSNRYRLGQRVFIKCKDLFIGRFGSLPQIGMTGYNEKYQEAEMSRIPSILEKKHIFLDGEPGDLPKPIEMTIDEIKNAPVRPLSQLVTIKNVWFEEGGKNTFAEMKNEGIGASNPPDSRIIVDSLGAKIVVSTSRFARFARRKLPTGTGDITVIVGFYRMSSSTAVANAWQLNIRDLYDLGEGFTFEP